MPETASWRIVITVVRAGDQTARDVEVPAGLSVRELRGLIAQALRWDTDPSGHPQDYALEAFPPGRLLRDEESLAAVDAWDGACLVLLPTQSAMPLPTPELNMPVTGWRPLDFASPDVHDASRRPAGQFAWKRVDSQ